MGPGPRRFRFAPTPSRAPHVGNALAALIGWAAARRVGGVFILRIEDIDRTRCKPALEAAWLEDLRWLGVDWDEGPQVGGPHGPYRQSERFERYDALLDDLAGRGLAYPCHCSRADVRAAQSAPHLHQGGELPYPGTCRPRRGRALGPSEPHERVLSDRGGYRFDVSGLGPRACVSWVDGWTGPAYEDVRWTCGDFLLGRPGSPSYQLAATADDVAMGITDVVRGRDLLGSSARQVLLWRALGRGRPRFFHHPLMLDSEGRKLSKRDGDALISHQRENGTDPARLRARLGREVGLFSPAVVRAAPADFIDALELLSSRG